LRSGLSGGQKYGNSIWVSYIIALSDCFRLETANDAQNVKVGTACRKYTAESVTNHNVISQHI